MTWKQYWYEHDIDMIQNAIEVSGIPDGISDKIFEKEFKRKVEPFAFY